MPFGPQMGPKIRTLHFDGIVLSENVLTHTLHVYWCHQRLNEQQITNVQTNSKIPSIWLFEIKSTLISFRTHFIQSQVDKLNFCFSFCIKSSHVKWCSINTEDWKLSFEIFPSRCLWMIIIIICYCFGSAHRSLPIEWITNDHFDARFIRISNQL